MSIIFKPIEVSDREIITSYTMQAGIPICDLSFANLYGWSFLYRTSWAEYEGNLLIRFYRSHEDPHPRYLLPLSKDGCSEKLAKAIEVLAMIAEKGGYPLSFMGISPCCRNMLESRFKDQFTFFSDRDWQDYIYLREKMVSLSGKKLQSKRNLLNRFKAAYPNYRYEIITDANKDACYELTRQWYKDKSNEEASEDELKLVRRLIDNRDAIGLQAGSVWVEDRLIGFSLGMPINHDTFDICVEKADTDIPEAFAIINNEFARHIPEQYTYLNREEDLGIEGLRHAKLQYKPVEILLKDTAILRTGNTSILDDELVDKEIPSGHTFNQ